MQNITEAQTQSRYLDIQRRVVAHKTVESWVSTPHATLDLELDVTDLIRRVEGLKRSGAFAGVRLTLNSVLLKLIAEGLKQSPEMNAHVQYDRRSDVGHLTLFDAINIAVPLRGPDGRTITPVVTDVGRKSLRDVCLAMDALKAKAANTNIDLLLLDAGLQNSFARLKRGHIGVLRRMYANLLGKGRLPRVPGAERARYRRTPEHERITPANLLSATVLVSNVGSVLRGPNLAVGLLEIIQPQTTAIGLGPVVRKPVAVEEETGPEHIAIRSVLPVTICFEHRAMDLEHVKGFITEVDTRCRAPWTLLNGPASVKDNAALPAPCPG